MKYWMIFMLVGLIHFNGFTQSNYQRIKVSHDIELVKLIRKFPSATIVIPGHGEFGGMELIKHTRELCNGKLKMDN